MTKPLGQGDLEKLPSQEYFYSKFKSAQDTCDGVTSARAVDDPLKGYDNLQNYWDHFVKAWCCMSKMEEGQQQLYEERCNFLYYYIGSLIPSTGAGGSFQEIMKKIYEGLSKIDIEDKCSSAYTNIDRNLFMQRRKVHDFSYDYQIMKSLLAKNGNSCDGTYYKHLQDAVKAYNDVCVNGGWRRDTYCNKFEEAVGGYEPAKVLQLTSKTETVPRMGEPSGNTILHRDVSLKFTYTSNAHEGYHTNASTMEDNIITAVYSSLGMMTLPMIAFFLYKYTSLFDGIKNTFLSRGGRNNSNNRRGRRSTMGRNQHFDDTFTENSMDFSTKYLTDTSTNLSSEVDSTMNLSTASSTATEDNSAIYDGRPLRGERGASNYGEANNKQQQRQQEQGQRQQQQRRSQHGQRTNMAYHKM
ncbi:KIR protein [Plasmodium knowlesi strain H]|uniref:KIR protein n=3 Tax=Plasmodium knowlesi TaxID=5850 RepID=A0A5K1VSP7_PLAKH|nr:KIR protein [Plasmodium knowlesi strain H]OTN64013.1 KIR protein [Plasmodium knowlesi]CAA9991142.1 KIR protein [Plasmodium knowlesi strain H]SBO20915.1 KIR protein [Plasmodium knowlesi strain H]VVS80616.1 KIR protein [Plasmodium knowlesi strain H]|eukprot:XP_002262426.1 KIR protein [Plasmodium knowlesi strain H]